MIFFRAECGGFVIDEEVLKRELEGVPVVLQLLEGEAGHVPLAQQTLVLRPRRQLPVQVRQSAGHPEIYSSNFILSLELFF